MASIPTVLPASPATGRRPACSTCLGFRPACCLAAMALGLALLEGLREAGLRLPDPMLVVVPAVLAQAYVNGWRWGLAGAALAVAWCAARAAGGAERVGWPDAAAAALLLPVLVAGAERLRRRALRDVATIEALSRDLRRHEARLRAIAEATPVGIFVTEGLRRCVFGNEAFRAIAGFAAGDDAREDWAACVHPEDRRAALAQWRAAVASGQPFRAELRVARPGAPVAWIRVVARAYGVSRRGRGYVGAVEDVTERRLADEAFRAQARRRRVMLDNYPGLCAYIDRDCRYRFVSTAYESWLGRPVSAIEGAAPADVLPAEVWKEVRPYVEQALGGGRSSTTRSVHRSGGRLVREVLTFVPDRSAEGRVEGVFLFSIDMTERLEAEEGLAREKERLAVTLQSIADAVVTVDARGCVDYMNPVAQSLSGWNIEAAAGRPVREIVLIGDETRSMAVSNPVEDCLRLGAPVSLVGDHVLCRRDADLRAVDLSVAPIASLEGEVQGAVVVFRDVSASRRLAQQLTWHAQHDLLTGLANRRQFEHCVELAIDSARRGERHAVIYIDLDQFKIVNDTCGHAAGDCLLREVSAMLAAKARASDVLARLGGDEFGMLLRQCPMDRAQEIAERMRARLEAYRFSFEGRTFVIGGSFGLVAVDERVASVADVLRAADVACYAAKEAGRNRVHRYEPGDREIARRRNEMEWVGRVRTALEDDRFVLHGQPIVPLAHAGAAHVEVLLRLRGEAGDLVPPMAWIPAAERYGIMPRLDRWVIAEAFRYIAARTRAGAWADDALCAINLSGASLTDDRILDFVHQELAETGIRPQQVCFEITETAVIANLAQARHLIAELRRIGMRFALDDFGAGMSSFGYLKALPVDFLKIDGSFVRRIADDPVDYAMVEAINKLGHVMGIRTIAESVENEAVLARLRALGVDYAQGYHLARPCELESAEAAPGGCTGGVAHDTAALPALH